MSGAVGRQMQNVYDAMDRLAFYRRVAGRPPLVACIPGGNAELGRKLVGKITRIEARKKLAEIQKWNPNNGAAGRAWRRCWGPEESE